MGSKRLTAKIKTKIGYVLVLKRCQIKNISEKANKQNKPLASFFNTVLKSKLMYCLSKKTVRILKQNVVLKTNNKIKQTKSRKKTGSYESECDISCFMKINTFQEKS